MPDEFDVFEDLDSLSDEGFNLDDADLSSFGEIDTSIEFPHIKVNTKKFQEFLRIAKLFSVASGRDVISKSVSFSVEGGRLACRVTDFDSYLTYYFDLLNDSNQLDEHVAISVDILQKLVKACPANMAILKDEEGFKMRVAGGDIIMETFAVPVEKFQLLDSYEGTSSVEASELLGVIRAFTPVVNGAVTPTERRIVFKDSNAYASYMWAIVRATGSYPSFELKVKDLSILKNLLLNREGEVVIASTVDGTKVPRTVIHSDDFVYATITSSVEMSTQMVEAMKEFEDVPGVHIDLLQLFKMVELSADLPYSIGKIGLNYVDDGIQLAIKTKKGKDSMFTIQGSLEGRPKELSKELVIQSRLLRVLLRSFSGQASVRMSLSDKGIGIFTENYQACCFVEG